jgi:hypothetical protein
MNVNPALIVFKKEQHHTNVSKALVVVKAVDVFETWCSKLQWYATLSASYLQNSER